MQCTAQLIGSIMVYTSPALVDTQPSGKASLCLNLHKAFYNLIQLQLVEWLACWLEKAAGFPGVQAGCIQQV